MYCSDCRRGHARLKCSDLQWLLTCKATSCNSAWSLLEATALRAFVSAGSCTVPGHLPDRLDSQEATLNEELLPQLLVNILASKTLVVLFLILRSELGETLTSSLPAQRLFSATSHHRWYIFSSKMLHQHP